MLLAQVVETSQRVAETSRRLEKVELLAALLPQLDSMHRSLIYGAARDMATGHRRIA